VNELQAPHSKIAVIRGRKFYNAITDSSHMIVFRQVLPQR